MDSLHVCIGVLPKQYLPEYGFIFFAKYGALLFTEIGAVVITDYTRI